MANIRISRKDKVEYNRLRRNTLSKIRRTKNKYGIDLSSEVDLTSLDSFTKRKDFNKWKAEQESFTNRGNTNYQFAKNKLGTVASKKELYIADKKQRDSIKLEKAFKEKNYAIPVIHQGEQIGTVGQRMQMVARPSIANIHAPKEFNFEDMKDRTHLEDTLANLEEKSKPEYYDKMLLTMQLNYLDKIEQDFGSTGNKLFDKIYAMSPDEFNEMYLSNPAMSFDIFYSEADNDDSLIDFALHLETLVDSYNSEENKDLRHPNFR